jgi:Rieske Fe-S protein
MKRRDFIPRVISGSAIIAAIPLVMTSCEEEDPPVVEDNNDNNDDNNDNNDDNNALTVDLDDSNYVALKENGGFAYAGSIIIINTGNEEFIALSSRCTHSGCTVNYSSTQNNLPCPCHGSVFAVNGTVLNGPANSPLDTYTVEREGNILTIT